MALRRPEYHRLRLLFAFIALSGRTWAFPGPAAIISRSRSTRSPTLLPAAKKGKKKSRPKSRREQPPSPLGGGSRGFGVRSGSSGDGGGPDDSAAPTDRPPASQSDSRVHSDLILWIKSNDDAYVNPKFAVRPSDLGGYGGFATAPLRRGEVLFRVPRTMCVTYDDALSVSVFDYACLLAHCSNDSPLYLTTRMIEMIQDMYSGEYYGVIKDKRVKDWGLILLAGWLAEERMLSEDSRRAGSEIYTKHKPYTDSVPWGRDEFGQDHVLYWTDEEVERKLGGSPSYDDAMLIRRTADGAARMLGEFTLPVLMSNRENLELDDTSLETLEREYADAVRAAMAICLSRSFEEEVEGDDGRIATEVCLLPLIDVLQHSNVPNTRLESYDDFVLVLAARDVDRNEELFHRYQEENERVIPKHKWFTRYGFIPGSGTSVEELLRDRSGTFFDS